MIEFEAERDLGKGGSPSVYELQNEIRKLRRIICMQSVPNAYMDDGEASYGGNTLMKIRPFDFLRSNSKEIEKFLREYHLSCYNFKIENEMVLNPAP
jgi:hypothetical protein